MKTVALILIIMFAFVGVGICQEVTLSWDKNNADGYKLHYGTASKDYKYIIDVGKENNYTIKNLKGGITYYFNVTSYIGKSHSNFGEEIAYTVPSK